MSEDVGDIAEAERNRKAEAAERQRQAEIRAFEAERRRIEVEARQARLEAQRAAEQAQQAERAEQAAAEAERPDPAAGETDPQMLARSPSLGTVAIQTDSGQAQQTPAGSVGEEPQQIALAPVDPAQVGAVLARYEAQGDALVAEVRAPADAVRTQEYETLRDMNGPLGGLIRPEDVTIPLSRRGDVLEQQIAAIDRYKQENTDWETNPFHRQNIERALAASVIHEAAPRAQGLSPGEAGTAILNVGAGIISLPGNVFNLVTNRNGALDDAIEAGGQVLGQVRDFAGNAITGAFNVVTGRQEAPSEEELAAMQTSPGLPVATTGDRNLDRAGQQANGLLDQVFRAIDPSSAEGRINLTEGLIQAGIASQLPAANDALGRAGQRLAQRNAAIVAAREGTTPASTLVSRALDKAEDVLNTRTVSTLGAREISASTRNLQLQSMPASATQPIAFTDAIRYPASNLTPTLGQQLSYGVQQGIDGVRSVAAAGAGRLQQTFAPLTSLADEALTGPKSFMDNVNQLNTQVRKAVGLATTGETLGPVTATVHGGIDTIGATFNLAAQTTKPLWNPVLNVVREGAKATSAATATGLGIGAATGNLQVGQFNSSDPQTDYDRQTRLYMNIPANLQTNYLWAGSDAEGPVSLVGCAWGGGLRRLPMANPLEEGQRVGSPLRLNVSPKGASAMLDSPVLGPTLLCSAQVRAGENYGISNTAVVFLGRTAAPNNMLAVNSQGATLTTGAQTGPASSFVLTKASLGDIDVTSGSLLNFGAFTTSFGSNGISLGTKPLAVLPFMSAAPNLAATPRGEEKPEHRMIREFFGFGEPQPSPTEPTR